MATSTPEYRAPESETVVAEVRPGEYGTKVIAVEPGGAEFAPLNERHGKPVHLLWTWLSPNLEFATVFLGVLATGIIGLTFWQAFFAILLGTGLGSFTHGVLSGRGPRYGVPQMVLSRIAFGWFGNVLPAGLNAIIAGIGWFAVNSVSGALALNALTTLPKWLCLLVVVAFQVVIAFYGHNLVQTFERYAAPVLAVIFAIACIMTFTKADFGSTAHASGAGIGGFLVIVGATFGYAAGWNPYAADYTRYLPADSSPVKTGLSAGLGVFLSCFVLEVAGAASVSIAFGGNPTEDFTSYLGTFMGDLTLLAIALGAVAANAINIYSGALSFTALGFRIPLKTARAVTALVFGVLGLIVAFLGLNDISKYENFLLVISYWIGPWLGVYLVDWYLRRGHRVDGFLFDRKHTPYAGWVSMLVGMALSIWLFADQSLYTGLVPSTWPSFGDIAFFVGFLIAGALYAVIHSIERSKEPQEAVLVTPKA
ncbi:purine-cytosine permease family protein [Petropleomorpha daqingensis]|uniref:NCS1 nucleoside transporter family n=1 Tax=Petropleomorpha daqingensis TaxID=2026353 RepID=A0A853CH90_9ACTN|nr:cytosine permease [Petropleomorpha daqingensis]NYJ05658.1 NCS1 nucleoside transporter family [Petropleomorpha daqingensis]